MKKILVFILFIGLLCNAAAFAQQPVPILTREWVLESYKSNLGEKFTYKDSNIRLSGGALRFPADCNHCHMNLDIDINRRTIKARKGNSDVVCTALACAGDLDAPDINDKLPLPDEANPQPQSYAPSFFPNERDAMKYEIMRGGLLAIKDKNGTFYFRTSAE